MFWGVLALILMNKDNQLLASHTAAIYTHTQSAYVKVFVVIWGMGFFVLILILIGYMYLNQAVSFGAVTSLKGKSFKVQCKVTI